MTLYLIGLGLADKKDVSVKGLEAIKKCDEVYLETYTGILPEKQDLERFYNKKIIPANRQLVEQNPEKILEKAKKQDVALLVQGDVFSATTHTDLYLRAKKTKTRTIIIHGSSIVSAIGVTGLEVYKFGKTASIPLPQKSYKPESFFDVLEMNQRNGLHTLFLLDPNNGGVTINKAIEMLLDISAKRKRKTFTQNTKCLGCARIGAKDQMIRYGKAKDLQRIDFEALPHVLVVPGKLHFVEQEALNESS
jgi:diphthine synthase